MSIEDSNKFIESDPEKMGGTVVFSGTRVPVQNLFDYLKAGDGVETFIEHFPTVSRDQVIGTLELFKLKLLTDYEIAA